MIASEILKSYAAEKLTSCRRSVGDERQAQIAANFATEDLVQTYRQYVRQLGEQYALGVITAELEDVQRANQVAAERVNA